MFLTGKERAVQKHRMQLYLEKIKKMTKETAK